MELFVQGYDDDTKFVIEVGENDTTETMRQKVATATGLCEDSFRMGFGGKEEGEDITELSAGDTVVLTKTMKRVRDDAPPRGTLGRRPPPLWGEASAKARGRRTAAGGSLDAMCGGAGGQGGEKGVLQKYLRGFDMRVKDAGGNGDCQFKAVSMAVHGDATAHGGLREMAVGVLEREAENWGEHVDGGPSAYRRYCSAMAKQGSWGDHLTLKALAEVLMREVYAFSVKDGEVRVLKVHPKEKGSGAAVTVAYVDACHYLCVLPTSTGEEAAEDRARKAMVGGALEVTEKPYTVPQPRNDAKAGTEGGFTQGGGKKKTTAALTLLQSEWVGSTLVPWGEVVDKSEGVCLVPQGREVEAEGKIARTPGVTWVGFGSFPKSGGEKMQCPMGKQGNGGKVNGAASTAVYVVGRLRPGRGNGGKKASAAVQLVTVFVTMRPTAGQAQDLVSAGKKMRAEVGCNLNRPPLWQEGKLISSVADVREDVAERCLKQSGKGGVFFRMRREQSEHLPVVWLVDGVGLEEAQGLATRMGGWGVAARYESLGIRVKKEDQERANAALMQEGKAPEGRYVVSGFPSGTSGEAVMESLAGAGWTVTPLRRLEGWRWVVGAKLDPPTWAMDMEGNGKGLLIRKDGHKEGGGRATAPGPGAKQKAKVHTAHASGPTFGARTAPAATAQHNRGTGPDYGWVSWAAHARQAATAPAAAKPPTTTSRTPPPTTTTTTKQRTPKGQPPMTSPAPSPEDAGEKWAELERRMEERLDRLVGERLQTLLQETVASLTAQLREERVEQRKEQQVWMAAMLEQVGKLCSMPKEATAAAREDAAAAAAALRQEEEEAKAAAAAALRQREEEAKAAAAAVLKQREEEVKAAAAAALRQEEEEEAKAAAAAALRQREEEAKAAAAAVLKQREEEVKAAAAAALRQREEEAKAAAAAALKQREEEVKAAAAAALRQREEEVKAAAAAVLKQREEEVKAAAAAALRQEEEVAAAAALKQREEEVKAAAAAALRQREEEEKAAAAAVLKQREEADAAAAILWQQEEEAAAAAAAVAAENARQREGEAAATTAPTVAVPTAAPTTPEMQMADELLDTLPDGNAEDVMSPEPATMAGKRIRAGNGSSEVEELSPRRRRRRADTIRGKPGVVVEVAEARNRSRSAPPRDTSPTADVAGAGDVEVVVASPKKKKKRRNIVAAEKRREALRAAQEEAAAKKERRAAAVQAQREQEQGENAGAGTPAPTTPDAEARMDDADMALPVQTSPDCAAVEEDAETSPAPRVPVAPPAVTLAGKREDRSESGETVALLSPPRRMRTEVPAKEQAEGNEKNEESYGNAVLEAGDSMEYCEEGGNGAAIPVTVVKVAGDVIEIAFRPVQGLDNRLVGRNTLRDVGR